MAQHLLARQKGGVQQWFQSARRSLGKAPVPRLFVKAA